MVEWPLYLSVGWTNQAKFHCPLFSTLFLIDDILNRYDEAPADLKPYRQKDGALLAIGTLCDKLKQTNPYKTELESMLVRHVFPEFNSRVGHLRAKVEYISSSLVNNDIED